MFRLDPAGNFTKLADLGNSAFPSGLKRDGAGNLYFATQNGGRWPNGAVLKLDTGGKISVLYKFQGAVTWSGISLPEGGTGSGLNAGVILDSAGNLYGTSPFAGTAGILYEIEAGGTVRRLHNFLPAHGGMWPWTGLTPDPAGVFYGTTVWGGGSGDDARAADRGQQLPGATATDGVTDPIHDLTPCVFGRMAA